MKSLDEIESKLLRVRGEVEQRKMQQYNSRPRSLNLTTLYCSEVAQSTPLISANTSLSCQDTTSFTTTDTSTPVPSIASTAEASAAVPLILVRHRPLSPRAMRLQRNSSAVMLASKSPSFQQQYADQQQQRPLRPIYLPSAQSSALRHEQQRLEHKRTTIARLGRCCSELAWFLVGVRYLFAEIPLLIFTAFKRQHPLHFYFTLGALLTPGVVSLVYVIRNDAHSCFHRLVRCIFVVLRLESLLRFIEMCIPKWRGGPPWPARLALHHASAGSSLQILVQAATIGYCVRPAKMLPMNNPDIFKGANSVQKELYPTCELVMLLLSGATLLVSTLHISWALAYITRLRVDKAVRETEPELWRLLQRTSIAVALFANLMLSGARTILIMLGMWTGWDAWHLAIICVIRLSISATLQTVRYCRRKITIDPLRPMCWLVACDPRATRPHIVARRCCLLALQHAILLSTAMARTHGAYAASVVYRAGLLSASISFAGMIMLAARLRWVHPTKTSPCPAEGGKCFSKRLVEKGNE